MSAFIHRSCSLSSKLLRRHLCSSSTSILIPRHPTLHQTAASSAECAVNFSNSGLLRLTDQNPIRSFSSAASDLRESEIAPPGTVKRDLSPLADETRRVLDDTMRAMYGLSRVAAALGLAQIGIGVWVYYYCLAKPASGVPNEVSAAMTSCAVAVGFPLCLAFILRRRLRAMFFGKKMEEEGRLQILRLNLQVAKSMNLLFVRLRSVCCVSMAGLVGGFLYTVILYE